MTQETPPGWYADPGQTSDGPATERWWDGRTWTDRIRPAQPPATWGPPTGPASAGPSSPTDQPPGSASPAPDGTAPSGTQAPKGQPPAAETPAGAPGAGEPGAGAPAGTEAPGAGQPAGAASPGATGQPSGAGPTGEGQPAGVRGPAAAGQVGSGVHPAAAGYPAYPACPATPPGGRGRRLRTGAAVAAAVVVLASIGVGVYALTDNSGGGGSPTSQGPGGPGTPGGQGGPFGGPGGSGGSGGSGGDGGSGGQSPRPEQSAPPKIRGGSVTDAVSGISLPIPKGWYGQEAGIGAQVTSEDSYKCPGDTASTCTKGGAYSAPALALGTKGTTAEEIAKADIAANAEESYGGKAYGGITSHDVLDSKAVTVAGQKGYLVRWKAVTRKGADGIVESLAFPSPANAKRMVVVRFGVDADQKETVLDEITEGIKVSTGSGNGQDV
ncbi:DUF2510 domain-containing protein [Streptomyces sp. NPDC057424]|uniref:DUF2510 domain-containing protein n=1 Tax=Streptomyces sp. NPDC057424 TaxID=3346127 RepID=UPI003692B0AE